MNKLIKTALMLFIYIIGFLAGVVFGIKIMVFFEFKAKFPLVNYQEYLYNRYMLKDCLKEVKDNE